MHDCQNAIVLSLGKKLKTYPQEIAKKLSQIKTLALSYFKYKEYSEVQPQKEQLANGEYHGYHEILFATYFSVE